MDNDHGFSKACPNGNIAERLHPDPPQRRSLMLDEEEPMHEERLKYLFTTRDALIIIKDDEWTYGTKREIDERLEGINKEIEEISRGRL